MFRVRTWPRLMCSIYQSRPLPGVLFLPSQVCALGLLLLHAGLLAGQTVPLKAATPSSTQKGDMAPAYVDGSFGFSVGYPAGAVIEREKRFVTTADLEIVRFVQMQHTWSLAVWLSSSPRPVNSESLLRDMAGRLSVEHENAQIVRRDSVRVGTREGVRLAVTFSADEREWLWQQAAVITAPSEYFTLTFITPLDDREVASGFFDEILDGFSILRSELMQERITAALRRGATLLQTVAGDRTRFKALIAERDTHLRLVQDGRDIGFIRIHEGPGQVDHYEGLAVCQQGWLFPQDQSVTQFQYDMFLSADLAYARWDNRVRVLTPGQEGKPAHVGLGVEHGLQQNDKLVVTYTAKLNDPEMKEKVLELESTFGSPAWLAVLPRLVDLEKPEAYAFSTYDGERHGLILRVFQVVGPTHITLDGQRVPVFRLEDSEGLIPPINQIDVDAAGRMVRVSAGPLEMLATTPRYVQQNYEARVAKALETMKQYSIRPPSPPGGGSR